MAYRPVIEDDTLPHQIRIRHTAAKLHLSCTCRAHGTGYRPIESWSRPREPVDVIDAWYAWHASRGMPQPRTVPRDAILGLETVP